MSEPRLQSSPGFQTIDGEPVDDRHWNAHLMGHWRAGEAIRYRLRVCAPLDMSLVRFDQPPRETRALELVACAHGQVVAATEEDLLTQLRERARDVEPEPRFTAFGHQLYKCYPQISEDEFAPFAEKFPQTHAIMVALTRAILAEDAETMERLGQELRERLASLTAYQNRQRAACPTCTDRYTPQLGERAVNYACPDCLSCFYHQHTYDYSPIGSSDDFYHVELSLEPHLEPALELTSELKKRTVSIFWRTIRARVRIIAYAAFLLHWEHWLS